MTKSLAELIREEREAEARQQQPGPGTDLIPPGLARKASDRRKAFAAEYLFGARSGKPFNATEAYRTVNGPKTSTKTAQQQGSCFLKHPEVQEELARLVKEAAAAHKLDQDFVLGHWIAMSKANIYDYFELETRGENAGHVVLKARDSRTLTPAQQQNVRKLKVRNVARTIKDVTIEEQTLELEIEHKRTAIENIAKFLGMLRDKGPEDDGANIAEELREAERRVLNRAVTIDNATGKVIK